MRLLALALCACIPAAWPATPEHARDATFKVALAIGKTDTGFEVLNGTAWVAATAPNGHARLLTAGHVCRAADLSRESSYWLLDYAGNQHAAHEVRKSKDPDLCLLEAEEALSPPLALATRDTWYGEHIEYVGAPGGIWGSGVAPIFSGLLTGVSTASAPVAGGASGSPVFVPGDGVIGVLVAGSQPLGEFYFEDEAAIRGILAGP